MQAAQKTQKEKTYDKGVWAEKYAATYLAAKGYKVLETRYKTSYGEIDLIIKKDNVIAFVEVKARRSIDEALQSITPKMKERIANTAQYYLSQNAEALKCDLRFDVIAIKPPLFLAHLDNAWHLDS
ncbi:MAG: YraN family protein [Alphaproteobacteria bacterium]|nr:YraN family protein [Alphaproteobacteria bacterium]